MGAGSLLAQDFRFRPPKAYFYDRAAMQGSFKQDFVSVLIDVIEATRNLEEKTKTETADSEKEGCQEGSCSLSRR